MHYFKKNIGEYHIKAGRLCMLEHGAYTLLIDACYDREQFPTLEQAIDWCWARSEAEIEAVKFVLGKFFELKDGVYIENDIAEAVAKYQANADTNRRIAQEREAKRKEKKENTDEASTDRERSVDEAPPNYKLRTNNQELKLKNIKSAKKFTDDDLAMAEQFHQSLVASIPGFKEPNLEAWANDIRLMRERDNRTPESILAIWAFARQDHFWKTNVLCPGTLREKFDKLTAKALTAVGKPSLLMVSGWQPSSDSKEFLMQRGVDLRFAEDAIPEFELYWREKNQSCDNWDKKFRDHVLRSWARHVAALQHDTSPRRIDKDWQPEEQAYAALAESGVDELFAQSLVSEFVIFWRESNQMHNAWNAKFIAHAKQKWSQRLAPEAQLTRDISISQHLSDRSWAT